MNLNVLNLDDVRDKIMAGADVIVRISGYCVNTKYLTDEQRRELTGRGRAQSRGFNAKLAVVQPYSLTQAVIDAATSSGKTVILVDPYKTSRVEFETGYVHEAKISLSVRGWPSPVDGSWVDRDINAARNILSWGKSPSLHRRHIETGCDPLELVTVH